MILEEEPDMSAGLNESVQYVEDCKGRLWVHTNKNEWTLAVVGATMSTALLIHDYGPVTPVWMSTEPKKVERDFSHIDWRTDPRINTVYDNDGFLWSRFGHDVWKCVTSRTLSCTSDELENTYGPIVASTK